MLSITSNAAQVVGTIRAQQGVPDGFGLRVFPQQSPDGVAVQLAFAEQPADGDQVTDEGDVRLFVDPQLAEPLSDSVIDAQETPDGTGLVIRQTEQT